MLAILTSGPPGVGGVGDSTPVESRLALELAAHMPSEVCLRFPEQRETRAQRASVELRFKRASSDAVMRRTSNSNGKCASCGRNSSATACRVERRAERGGCGRLAFPHDRNERMLEGEGEGTSRTRESLEPNRREPRTGSRTKLPFPRGIPSRKSNANHDLRASRLYRTGRRKVNREMVEMTIDPWTRRGPARAGDAPGPAARGRGRRRRPLPRTQPSPTS